MKFKDMTDKELIEFKVNNLGMGIGDYEKFHQELLCRFRKRIESDVEPFCGKSLQEFAKEFIEGLLGTRSQEIVSHIHKQEWIEKAHDYSKRLLKEYDKLLTIRRQGKRQMNWVLTHKLCGTILARV